MRENKAVLQPDADLLWLEEGGVRVEDIEDARKLLSEPREVVWSNYLNDVDGLTAEEVTAHLKSFGAGWQLMISNCQIAPMVWPSDLQYRGPPRKFAGLLPGRRRDLCNHLRSLFPTMNVVLDGDAQADPLFSSLVRDGMRSQGYDDSGDSIPGSSQTSITTQDFFDRRMRHPDRCADEERRRLLDAGDEAIVTYMADQLRAPQPPRGQVKRLYVKATTAGRVYFAYAALEWYTGISRTEMPEAIAGGRVIRPASRWEHAWVAYSRLTYRSDWADSHRIITPRLEVPVATLVSSE